MPWGGNEMDQELMRKFEQAREMTIPIDVQRGVMDKISTTNTLKKPHSFLLPILLGLAVALMIIVPLAESPGPEPLPEEPVLVVIEYPRRFSPYPSPYGNLEMLRIKKGSETL